MGSPLDKLLWNIAIMRYDGQVGRRPAGRYNPTVLKKQMDGMKFTSVRDRIKYKRAIQGIE